MPRRCMAAVPHRSTSGSDDGDPPKVEARPAHPALPRIVSPGTPTHAPVCRARSPRARACPYRGLSPRSMWRVGPVRMQWGNGRRDRKRERRNRRRPAATASLRLRLQPRLDGFAYDSSIIVSLAHHISDGSSACIAVVRERHPRAAPADSLDCMIGLGPAGLQSPAHSALMWPVRITLAKVLRLRSRPIASAPRACYCSSSAPRVASFLCNGVVRNFDDLVFSRFWIAAGRPAVHHAIPERIGEAGQPGSATVGKSCTAAEAFVSTIDGKPFHLPDFSRQQSGDRIEHHLHCPT